MKKIFFLLSCSIYITCLYGAELSHLYKKNCTYPESSYEKMLVDHAVESFSKAIQKKSKLNNTTFASDTSCNSLHGVIPYYHLINNLCSLKNASHLHIGLYKGGSFVSALYGNEEILSDKFGIDIFDEDYDMDISNKNLLKDVSCWYGNIFYDVCGQYLKKYSYQVITSDCFKIDKSMFKKPIDIYLYDADHSTIAHEKAFTYYNDTLADVFIAIVDDWNWEQVRLGTFKAFDKLKYKILYENEIPQGETRGNGQYLAVIKK